MSPEPNPQKGFGIAAAIFLLLVLAALAAFMVTVGGLQQTSSALDVQGARAYQAARAGIEWGVYRALRDNACTGDTFSLSGDLSDFTVTVTASATTYRELTATDKTICRIVATACNQPAGGACPGTVGPFYVERQLQATVDRSGP